MTMQINQSNTQLETVPGHPVTTRTASSVGVGHSFGTFGELLQGTLPPEQQHFMVTFPLAVWSTARFEHCPDSNSITVNPERKSKAARIARLAQNYLGLPGGSVLHLSSQIPEGKGMASSSADLVATVRAVADTAQMTLSEEEIECLLRRIEPTDGVMYDEIVHFGHRDVQLRERLGTLPALTVIAYDEGGEIDTIRYNSATQECTPDEQHEYRMLLDTMRDAIRDSDLRAVGRVATRSTELNARRNRRHSLDAVLRVCKDIDGLGVICAHSGTMLGIVLPHDDPENRRKTDSALLACAELPGSTSVFRSLGTGDNWSRDGAYLAG